MKIRTLPVLSEEEKSRRLLQGLWDARASMIEFGGDVRMQIRVWNHRGFARLVGIGNPLVPRDTAQIQQLWGMKILLDRSLPEESVRIETAPPTREEIKRAAALVREQLANSSF